MSKTDVVIDGSHGEGGGQIIRTSVALSAITGKSVQITNIRAKRPKPGLQAQHVEAINAVKQLCNAKVEGLELGSTEIIFIPNKITAKEININIPTAGSIGLVLQALLPPAFHSGQELTISIKGGATFGKWAPPLPYIEHVLLPILEKIGYSARINTIKHGFYPKGGAEVIVNIQKNQNPFAKAQGFSTEGRNQQQLALNQPLNLAKQLVNVYSFASDSLKYINVADRQCFAARQILNGKGCNVLCHIEYVPSDCPGGGILIFFKDNGIVIGADALAEKNKTAEVVGEEAARALMEELDSKAPVDSHTADQLIPYLAMNKGSILVSKITEHTKTNIWVCEQFYNKKFRVEGNLISFG